MKNTIVAITIAAAFSTAYADPVQSGGQVTGDNATVKVDQQLIGDTNASADHTQSTSTQLGNSANANGATVSPSIDTRDQNTFTPTSTTTSAGGSSTATGNTSANNSSVGNTTTGASTATTGPSVALAAGGKATGGSASGGAGGQGGASSSNSGGNTLAQSTRAALDKSGNSTVVVDASDRSRAVAWAPVIPGPVAAPLAVGNMSVMEGRCGPRVEIRRRDVIGKRFGAWGGQQDVVQGQDEITAPADQLFIQSGPYLMGHRVIRYMAVLGTSSAASFSVGGFSNSGGGAQGGAGGSGQMQQMVSRVAVEECVMAQEVNK